MINCGLFAEFGRFVVSQTLKKPRPLIVGINGCQGSGKSTLAKFLAHYIQTNFLLNVTVLSLDDFYLSHDARKQKAQDIHPLFVTRGVPGTHNINLLSETLTRLSSHQTPVILPSFDKGIDDLLPVAQWQHLEKSPDIIIIEGWCWGVEPQNEQALAMPVNSLEAKKDPLGHWRRHVNECLTTHYLPLYGFVDHWLFLRAPSFAVVKSWRIEQEQALISNGAAKAMSSEEVEEFIQYFQRLTEHALMTFHQKAHTVWWLDDHRHIKQVDNREC